ncbi:hypothetical protein SRO_4350 [Streptomyces rochei]|nr:hypothetical protein SRO_4350 [Streptomyces rochei]
MGVPGRRNRTRGVHTSLRFRNLRQRKYGSESSGGKSPASLRVPIDTYPWNRSDSAVR